MREFVRVIGSTAAAVLVPGLAAAQLCVGNPALAGNSAGNVGMGAEFFDGGKTYGGSATFGGRFFGSGSFTFTDFDDTDLSLKTVGGGLGFEIVPQNARVSVCPTVGVGYGFGLEILGVDFTTLSVGPAIALGFEVEISPGVLVAPYAQGGFSWHRIAYDAGPLGDDSETDTSGALVLGFGLIFNSRVSVGPGVWIPIDEEDGDTMFGFKVVFALGGQR